MTKHELLEAVKAGQKLYTEDHQLWLGDPAQFVDVKIVKDLIADGAIWERVIAEDYSVFELKETDLPKCYTDDSYLMADVG